jgi:hypothetical protein
MSTIRNRCHIFQLVLLTATSFVCLCASTVQAQTSQQPSPGPEHKKLHSRAGKWKYQGEAKANPFYPAGKFVGVVTGRMILSGFFLEERWEDKTEGGGIAQGMTVIGYDRVKKSFVEHGFESDGHANSAAVKVDGNTWSAMSSRADQQGKSYKTKWVLVYSEDGKKHAGTYEYSTDDGKTWVPFMELTATKVSD